MRKLVEDVPNEGLDSLLGERITFYCMNYFYTGKLVGVNDTYVKLTDVSVVFETGKFDDPEWEDAQKLPNDWYVQTSAIESFGILK
ncbi:hypothetical protein LCGC14_1414520 [marine sediment metagenome]|uniref:Uncharacterized protein n=1 Tax=marine sediment metagenome TaxID=412755 RepID=A0A0F9JTK9_9ZZZZ